MRSRTTTRGRGRRIGAGVLRLARHEATPALAALCVACSGAQGTDGDTRGTTPQSGMQASAGADALEENIARIRDATEDFRSLEEAIAAGYAPSGGRCLANPPHGAMGFHHSNAALLDDRLELERPEILVYERLPSGEYRLNGVEYIVPFSERPMNAEPPRILGQDLKPAPSLSIWYLHVWVWQENPSGVFADWNPAVKC